MARHGNSIKTRYLRIQISVTKDLTAGNKKRSKTFQNTVFWQFADEKLACSYSVKNEYRERTLERRRLEFSFKWWLFNHKSFIVDFKYRNHGHNNWVRLKTWKFVPCPRRAQCNYNFFATRSRAVISHAAATCHPVSILSCAGVGEVCHRKARKYNFKSTVSFTLQCHNKMRYKCNLSYGRLLFCFWYFLVVRKCKIWK